MSADPEVHDGAAAAGPGDLDTAFRAGPVFARAVAGYDRFQVDTYVRWAEDELAAADRAHERLVARLLRTETALDDARRQLGRSAGASEVLRVSGRMGGLLAAAADEAAGIRAEAEADRAAAEALLARAEADRAAAGTHARRLLADARARARLLVADATARAAEVTAAAAARAEATVREARAGAAVLRGQAREAARRAAADADRARREAGADAAAARLHARDDVVRLLGTARDARQRADERAAADRARLDREAAERRTALLAEVSALELRRAALVAEVAAPSGVIATPAGDRSAPPPRRLLHGVRQRPRSLPAP
jgi:hypothetical protein